MRFGASFFNFCFLCGAYKSGTILAPFMLFVWFWAQVGLDFCHSIFDIYLFLRPRSKFDHLDFSYFYFVFDFNFVILYLCEPAIERVERRAL